MWHTLKIIGLLGLAASVIAGCNSTEQTLAPIPKDTFASTEPANSAFPATPADPGNSAFPQGAPAATAPASPGLTSPSGQTAVAALPAGQIRGRIRFTPVIGAPVNAVTPLSRQLAVEAKNRGLSILSASDPGGDHVLKGYFSAETFDGRTTVFYVWDVLDPNGARLHRIQGQESFPGNGGSDPWAAVPANVMEKIAAQSMSEYSAWRGI